MKAIKWNGPRMVLCISVALGIGAALNAKPPEDPKADAERPNRSRTVSPLADNSARVDVAVARDRAKLMHDIYSATLEVMHQRYFHGERAVVPARAMEDVFSEIKRESKAEAGWISVNLEAMSINHEPKTEFEKRAAKEIAAGKTELEVIEDGYYRRAGAIPLTAGCTDCHKGFFSDPIYTPKFAGLVISIPVDGESAERE